MTTRQRTAIPRKLRRNAQNIPPPQIRFAGCVASNKRRLIEFKTPSNVKQDILNWLSEVWFARQRSLVRSSRLKSASRPTPRSRWIAGLSSPNIRLNAVDVSPSDPCSNRGNQRRMVLFFCNFMKMLFSRAGSNSVSVWAFASLSPAATSHAKSPNRSNSFAHRSGNSTELFVSPSAALVHGMTDVTRNVADFAATGVPLLNPRE